MFRQKDYQFFELAQKQIDQYVIQPGDELSVRLYTRDGFKLIDVLTAATSNSSTGTSSNSNFNSNNAITYLVDQEGFVRLPILGEMFVKGYTEKELQRVLAEKFSALFVDPFIITKVTNRRALVFRGGTGSVVSLNDAPTSLLEVIAKAGGLTQESKAYKIKVIRGDLKNPQVMLIDLSTLEGVRKADLIVQSNDIIYIEERRQNAAAVILSEISPYLGLVSTIATLVILVKAFGK
ncbi:MAG TPA: polysaccharide biosynthesis/export family protein [Chitinophagales bacterium]|nr:polysaccharide biosynthesis/export family protein [Chitinophagales bacterium]